MELQEELLIFLETEATTITALLDEIESGDNDPVDFIKALHQVSYRLKLVAKTLSDGQCT